MKCRISLGAFKRLLEHHTPDTIRFVILGAPAQEVNGKMHTMENAYAQLCMQEKKNGNLTCALISGKEEYEDIVRAFYAKGKPKLLFSNKELEELKIINKIETKPKPNKIMPMEEYAANLISTIKVPDLTGIKTKPKPKKRSFIKRLFNIKEE